MQLFLLYTKKRNKRAYKLAKELKESNRVIKEKSKAVLAEIDKINKISHQATQLNEMRLAHYKDRSTGLSLLENFSYNYNKIYPKNKGASKSDAENYKKYAALSLFIATARTMQLGSTLRIAYLLRVCSGATKAFLN